jgi:hypothetical protein
MRLSPLSLALQRNEKESKSRRQNTGAGDVYAVAQQSAEAKVPDFVFKDDFCHSQVAHHYPLTEKEMKYSLWTTILVFLCFRTECCGAKYLPDESCAKCGKSIYEYSAPLSKPEAGVTSK